MTEEERWQEIEECFDSIRLDVKNRCYTDRSIVGVRYIMSSVRYNLWRVDKLLLEALEGDKELP